MHKIKIKVFIRHLACKILQECIKIFPIILPSDGLTFAVSLKIDEFLFFLQKKSLFSQQYFVDIKEKLHIAGALESFHS
jgi:hypothetical protein